MLRGSRFTLAFLILTLGAFASAQTQHYVILGKNVGAATFADRVGANNGTVVSRHDSIGVVTADSADPNFKVNMAKEAGAQAVALDVELNWLNGLHGSVAADASITPSPQSLNAEPFTSFQWNMRQIRADQANAAGYLGAGARVAVLDAGAWYIDPDIAPNMNVALAKSFVPGEDVLPTVLGAFNHGTHVSGIIAAAINNRGTQGVAPQAEIVPVKVLAESGSGSFGWLIQGIDYASGPAVHADIINMSLGATFAGGHRGIGQDDYNTRMTALNRVMDIANKRGTLCIAAGNKATNLNGNVISIPAQSGSGKTITVSATGPVNLQNFEPGVLQQLWF
jgi:subtilisin family serine protease